MVLQLEGRFIIQGLISPNFHKGTPYKQIRGVKQPIGLVFIWILFFLQMKHIASYLLVALSGETPTKEKCIEVLKAGSCEPDADRMDSLFAALEGKNIDEIIAEGLKKIGSVSLGGGGAPAAVRILWTRLNH